MVCPNCGNNFNWRDSKCPHCGTLNPTQKKERSRKKRRRKRRRPILFLLLALCIILIILCVTHCGKGDAPKPTDPPKTIQTQEASPEETPEPSEAAPEPSETAPQTTEDAVFSTLEELAKSSRMKQLMKDNASGGDGVPRFYALVDLNGDGTQQLLVMSGEKDGYCDTLLFTADGNLSYVAASYDTVMLDPGERALAFQPVRPQGELQVGNYSGGYKYYKLHAASGALYPLYLLGIDEGVPQKDLGGVTEMITMEDWQEAMNHLQAPAWKELS